MRKRSMPKKISNSFPISYELNANIRPRFIWCCKLAIFSRSCGEEKCKFSSKGGCFEENSDFDKLFFSKGVSFEENGSFCRGCSYCLLSSNPRSRPSYFSAMEPMRAAYLVMFEARPVIVCLEHKCHG